LDEWAKFTSPSKLADRLHEYDSIRSTARNSLGIGPKGKIDEKFRPRTPPPEQKFKNKPFSSPQHTPKWTPRHRNEDLYKSKSKLTCFNCGKEGHTSSHMCRFKETYQRFTTKLFSIHYAQEEYRTPWE
ncbi:CCHC-type domain-containing protein, partial [Nephila pilipes]